MTREEYIQYRENDEIMPVAYEGYREGLKEGLKEYDYRTFVHAFSQYHEIMSLQTNGTYFDKVWRYYDKKFNLLFLERIDKSGKVTERLGIIK